MEKFFTLQRNPDGTCKSCGSIMERCCPATQGILMLLLSTLWWLLPDRCQMEDCARQGVRGNENVLPGGKLACDDCCVGRRQL